MAKSITDDLKKVGKSISIPFGLFSIGKEKIVAVDIQIESITISKLAFKKKKWQIESTLHETFIAPDGENPFNSDIGFYVSKLRTMLLKTNCVGLDGAIIIPFHDCQVFILDMELMPREEVTDMIEEGTFNDLFPELPKEISKNYLNYKRNFDFSIISKDEDYGTMKLAFVIGDQEKLQSSETILSRAGLNPVLAEPEVSSILNSLAVQFGNDAFLAPTAFLVSTENYSYLIIGSKDGIVIKEVEFNDADKVLLLHVEDVEDISGTVWKEVFSRIAEPIETAIDAYNKKFKENKVEKLFFISNRPKIDKYLQGLKESIIDFNVETMNPFEEITLSPKAKAYVDSFQNKSIFLKVIGTGMAKLNFFDIDYKDNSITRFNLLNDLENLKKSRKFKAINKLLLWSNVVFFAIFFSLLSLNSIPEINSNKNELIKFKTVKSNHSNLKKEHDSLSKALADANNVSKVIDNQSVSPNLALTTLVHNDILSSVPKGIKFNSMDFDPGVLKYDKKGKVVSSTPSKYIIKGQSIDDFNITIFLQNLKGSDRLYDVILQTNPNEQLLDFTMDVILKYHLDNQLPMSEKTDD